MTAEVVWVHPFFSQATSLNTDSNYTFLRQVLPAMSAQRPDWLFVVSWPMRAHGVHWNYVNDGLFSQSRILRVGWPYDSQMRTGVLTFDARRFDYIDSRFGPSIYWLQQVESGSQVAAGYRGSWSSWGQPVLVVQQMYVIHPSLPYPIDSLFPRLWAQMGGTVAADLVVLNSQHTARMMTESFSEYLTQEQMRAIGEKSVVLPFGLYDERFERAIAERKSEQMPDVPVVVFNHRFESYKNPQTTADVLNSLRASGRKFEVWATQMQDQRVKTFPVDRAVGHFEQSVYLRNIAVPAINTLNSQHETFCISAFESVALGHLLVAPRAVTFPELVPDGYPFLFENESEQRAMLATIIDSWPKHYVEWSDRLRAFARERFDFKQYVASYLTLFESLSSIYARSTPKPAVERALTKYAASLRRGVVLDFAKTVSGAQKATGNAEQAMPARRVVRELVKRGVSLVASSDEQGDAIAFRVGL